MDNGEDGYSDLEDMINHKIKRLCGLNEVNPPSADDISEWWKHAQPHYVCWLQDKYDMMNY